jgi:Holliday junction resolvase RusA-like endonuclease
VGQKDGLFRIKVNDMRVRVNIKPLSVNDCWKGQRFKTNVYKSYEKELLYTLPSGKMPEPPYRISFEFGLSNIQSDYDNPVKPLQDILQKKYGFNDVHIQEAFIKKTKVEKGKEYFIFHIESAA